MKKIGEHIYMNIQEFINGISSGAFDRKFRSLYGNSDIKLLWQKSRYISAVENFSKLFPTKSEIRIFSVSCRTEICGNPDGFTISSAVDPDAVAVVSPDDSDIIIQNGFDIIKFGTDELKIKKDEKGTPAELVKRICSNFEEKGIKTQGFNAYITSDIPQDLGFDPSASLKVLTAQIISSLCSENQADDTEIAEICNNTGKSGKNSSTENQMSLSFGGFSFADFKNPSNPTAIDFDFSKAGYSLCITNAKGNSQNLSAEYSEICGKIKHVAEEMGENLPSKASEEDFRQNLPQLRKKCSDLEILTAMHFFEENRRTESARDALETGDTEEFLSLIEESGISSALLLQNLRSEYSQQISLALAVSRNFLGGDGASKIHGYGFSGTIIAFVPNYRTDGYVTEMERIFGKNCCKVLSARNTGRCEITL